jgi:hypothetical protein
MQNNYLLPDHDAIGLTASILGSSETRVFELAYQEWYGKPAQQCELEHAFLAYLFEGRVECWVRAFTRHTLRLCDEAGVVLPMTQSGRNVTLLVTPAETIFKWIGLGAMFLARLVGGR